MYGKARTLKDIPLKINAEKEKRNFYFVNSSFRSTIFNTNIIILHLFAYIDELDSLNSSSKIAALFYLFRSHDIRP